MKFRKVGKVVIENKRISFTDWDVEDCASDQFQKRVLWHSLIVILKKLFWMYVDPNM